MSSPSIEVKPLTTALGAVIEGVNLSQPMGDLAVDEIRHAFLDHQVVFFRGQRLSPRDLKTFAERFGKLNLHPFVDGMADDPEILEVVKEPDETRNFGGQWHTDLPFLDRPPLGSILYAREVPGAGGDTMWANLYLAYEALSSGMKKLLDGLVAVHAAGPVYGQPGSDSGPRGGKTSMKLTRNEGAGAPVEHPVVRTHPETGRKCLFVDRVSTRHFKNMTVEESRPLLDYLCAHAVRPEFTCCWRWQADDVAFWDNRCTYHYALNDYPGQRRLMHRVAIEGDRPS